MFTAFSMEFLIVLGTLLPMYKPLIILVQIYKLGIIMVQLWTKDIDKQMLILEVLVQEYEKNGVKEIRHAALKELCDDMLNEKTEGRMEAYGGSF